MQHVFSPHPNRWILCAFGSSSIYKNINYEQLKNLEGKKKENLCEHP